MTTRELMDQFFANPLYNSREYRLFARILLRYVALHAYEVQLADGRRLGDGDISNTPILLRECADAIAIAEKQIPRRDHTCPDCGHEHEDKSECKHYLGEGKFCPCESKVTA